MKKLLLLAALAAFATTAVADEHEVNVQAHQDYRHHLMEVIGGNMAAIGDILKNRLPHTANIAVHAQSIHLASGLVESAFRAKALEGDKTESLPAIWEQWEEFVAAAKATEEAAANLAEVAEGGDPAAIGGAMRNLGRTCGSCHRTFRVQKD